jgi:hypothetical protein
MSSSGSGGVVKDEVQSLATRRARSRSFGSGSDLAPRVFGWGNYSDGAVGTFKNLTVLGNGGRGNEGNAIISGRKGRYDVTINIDGCHIENPNGTLVSLREDTMTLRGAITNAHIKLKSYAGEFQKGQNLLTVCGSTERRPTFDCTTDKP